jgi:hypothetical protein
MMVLAYVVTTSVVILLLFSLSPLMPPPPHHPILGRGRRSMRLLPVFVQHQARHRLAQWLLHVHEDVSYHARTIVFVVVRRPVRVPGLRPVLPPQPAAAHGRSREPTDTRRPGYGTSQSCSCPFSVCAVEEDMVAPATLRLSWRWGVQVWDIGQPRPVAWQQSTYTRVGGGVVSLRRIQGWEDTRILSPFSDWRLVRVPLSLELLHWASFSACVLSPYTSSGILHMSPSNDQVFVVSFSGNKQVCPRLPFSCFMKPWKWGTKDGGLLFAAYSTRAFIKILYEERRQLIKNLEIFLMNSLRGYYCEPSQRKDNRLVY